MFKTLKSTVLFGAVVGLSPLGVALAWADSPRSIETVSSLGSSWVAYANPQQQEEISRLLQQIGSAAGKTAEHADRLNSFTRIPLLYSWEAHASELSYTRDLVNGKGKLLARLKQLRPVALPWQQQAIDRIEPAIQSLASETSKAIRYANENRKVLFTPTYQEAVAGMYAHADTVRDYVGAKLSYVEAKAKIDQIEPAAETEETDS